MVMVEAGSPDLALVAGFAAGSLPSATLARQAGHSPSGAFSGSGCPHSLQIRIVSIFQPFIRLFIPYRSIPPPR
jgi:hypothetical protein